MADSMDHLGDPKLMVAPFNQLSCEMEPLRSSYFPDSKCFCRDAEIFGQGEESCGQFSTEFLFSE